jgi:hypothetical protein
MQSASHAYDACQPPAEKTRDHATILAAVILMYNCAYHFASTIIRNQPAIHEGRLTENILFVNFVFGSLLFPDFAQEFPIKMGDF